MVLELFLRDKNLTMSTKEIDDCGSTASPQSLGGALSALSKIKIDGESLIEAKGRVKGGIAWMVNEKVVSREQLQKLLDNLLDEYVIKKYKVIKDK